MTDKQPEALQVPLHKLLEAIPDDWRIGVKDGDDWNAGTTWLPVGVMCHQAASELRRLHEVNAELVEALQKIGLCIAHDNPQEARNVAAAAYAFATGEQQ